MRGHGGVDVTEGGYRCSYINAPALTGTPSNLRGGMANALKPMNNLIEFTLDEQECLESIEQQRSRGKMLGERCC